eukprot:127895_1
MSDCSTRSELSEYVTIAYGSLYAILVFMVSGYSFRFLMEYSSKFQKGSCPKKVKLWFMDIWKRRRCYVPLITHIFDQVTDYSVAIQFFILSRTQSHNDYASCAGLNIWYLFILTILSMAIYRIVSSFLIYQFTQSIGRIIIQLLDFELLRALYINYLCDKIEPCDPQRWLTTLEACLESSPQALIQLIYLSRTNTFTSSELVVISLVSSLWSIVSKLASDDKVTVIERAKRVNFKFKPIKILIDICILPVCIICIAILIAIGSVFVCVAIAIGLVLCVCSPLIYCWDRSRACGYGCLNSTQHAVEAALNMYKRPFTYIFSDLSDRFLWISLLYILRVIWRILDVTSHIFLMTLIWVAIGGTALTVKVVFEALAFSILCWRTQQWELLFGVVALVVSTTTLQLRKISIRIAVYRTTTNVIFMTLISVWFYVDFECPRCPKYESRNDLFHDGLAIKSMFIYTWCAVIMSPICVLLLVINKAFQNETSNSRDLKKMIKAKNYDGILEMQLYAGRYYVYDEENQTNLLMLAMQQHKSAVISHLMKIYDADKYNETDIKERNILDYYVRSVETSQARMTKNLMKIYTKYPKLCSKEEQFSIFLCACYQGNLDCVKALRGADANVIDDTTIHNLNGPTIAALMGHSNIVDFLYSNEKEEARLAAIGIVIKSDYVLKYDLSCIDKQTRNDPYRNALDYVFEGNKATTEIIEEIARRNPRLVSTKNQFTPFLFGCYNGNIQCVRKFVNPYEFDRGMGYAKENNYDDIVQYLRGTKVQWKEDNIRINSNLEEDKKRDARVIKILFLGANDSGKSTLFKQLRSIHGAGFADRDRLAFKDHVYENIISTMKLIIDLINDLKEDYPDEYGDLQLSDAGEKAAEFVDYLRDDIDVDDDVAQHIETLWNEAAVKVIYDQRSTLQISDSAAHFFDHVRRIADRNYIPTDQDMLMVRYHETGVVESRFEIQGTKFHIFHVGGQVSETRKWIHHFEFMTAIMFLASLSSYDRSMYEDEQTNMMHESLELYDQMCNSIWFEEAGMIVCLTKRDLFEVKIQKVPLTVCFPDYDGDNTYDDCIDYITRQFESRNRNSGKQIYTHVICATDTGFVEKMFNDVQNIVVHRALQTKGLLT